MVKLKKLIEIEEEKEKRERERDWTQVPLDLLQEIMSRLEIPDIIRFHSVCPEWRSVPIPPKLPQQHLHPPWLLLVRPPKLCVFDDLIRFYSLSEKCIYKFHLPAFWNYHLFTSPHGWLIAVPNPRYHFTNQARTVSLVNPITRTYIPLPPLPVGHEAPYKHCHAKLFPIPSESGSKFDVVLAVPKRDCSNVNQFSIFCLRTGTGTGDTVWRNVCNPPSYLAANLDFHVHNGCLFLNYQVSGRTDVYDMKTLDLVSYSTCPPVDAQQLVASPSPSGSGEELLLLLGRTKLFRWTGESDQQELKWVEVSSTGDGMHTFFYSFCQTICLGLRDYHQGCRAGNWIYSAKPTSFKTTFSVTNIRERLVDHQSFRDGISFTQWFVPSLC